MHINQVTGLLQKGNIKIKTNSSCVLKSHPSAACAYRTNFVQLCHCIVLTLNFTHSHLDASLTTLPGIFLRVIVGQDAATEKKPPRLPA